MIDRLKDWWSRQNWKEEALITVGTSVGICLVIWIGWLIAMNAQPSLSEGEVRNRDFTPAHWEDYMRAETGTRLATRLTCSGGYGDTPRTCHSETYTETYTYYVPDTRWVSDDWDLLIYGCTVNRQDEESCRDEWVDVTHGVYDDCQVRDYWREETACALR